MSLPQLLLLLRHLVRQLRLLAFYASRPRAAPTLLQLLALLVQLAQLLIQLVARQQNPHAVLRLTRPRTNAL